MDGSQPDRATRMKRLRRIKAARGGAATPVAEEDFDLGSFLADSAMGFGDQLDTIGRFLAKGLSVGQFDKLSAGIRSTLNDVGYDEQLRAEQARNKKLGKDWPGLAIVSEIGGSLLGIGKLMKSGVTFNSLLPSIAEKTTKIKKLLGYGGNVAAGAGDAAVISGLMAEGDGRDAFTAAETGSMWGAAFAALPGPAKIAFSKFAESRIGKPLMDKAGNWTPIHLIKGEHELLKQFFKTGIGGALGGGKLRDQERKYFVRMEAKEAEIVAKNAEKLTKTGDKLTAIERKDIAEGVKFRDKTMDDLGKRSADNIAKLEALAAEKLAAQELAAGAEKMALHTSTLKTAAPQGYAGTITKTGHDGVTQLGAAFKKAYEKAWSPVTGLNTTAIDDLITKAKAAKKGITDPTEKTSMGTIITTLNNLKKTGTASGVKALDDKLRKVAYSAGKKGQDELRTELNNLRGTLTSHLPADTQKALAAHNAKYPDYLVVKDAAAKSVASEGLPKASALVSSTQKISHGKTATNEGALQAEALAAHKLEQASKQALSDLKDQAAGKMGLQKTREARQKELAGRTLKERETLAANERTDRRIGATLKQKQANDARLDPVKAEIKGAQKDKIGQTPRLPMQVATSGILGGTVALPFAGAPLAAAVGVPLGVTLAKGLSSKTGQNLAAGQHGSQVWAREAQKNYGDTLRKFDKNTSLMTGLGKLNEATGMITGVRPALAGSMGKTDPEEERAKRRRRRY